MSGKLTCRWRAGRTRSGSAMTGGAGWPVFVPSSSSSGPKYAATLRANARSRRVTHLSLAEGMLAKRNEWSKGVNSQCKSYNHADCKCNSLRLGRCKRSCRMASPPCNELVITEGRYQRSYASCRATQSNRSTTSLMVRTRRGITVQVRQ